MYKLIAIDLDGTLLNSYGEISNRNKQAIKNAKANGLEIVLTSGRMSSSVRAIAEEIGANNYIIAGNGALVYDLKNETILYNETIPTEKVLKIAKICDENNIYYTVTTEKYILSKKLKYALLYYHHENSKKPQDKITNINIVEDVQKYINENDVGKITKIVISDESKEVFNGILKKFSNLTGINVLDVSYMSRKIIESGTKKTEINYYYSEITKENVNKWESIKKLAEFLNIQTNEIMTIGDNLNDLEMIMNAGIGIVMGNSALSNKELGKVIVSSNDLDGVAEAIEKFVLNK